MHSRPQTNRVVPKTLVIGVVALLTGCDPILDIGGAYFPSWILVLIGGLFTTLAARWGLDRTGIEPHLGPRGLVYLSMFIVFSILYWLIFYQT